MWCSYSLDERALSYWDVNSDGWKVAPGCYSTALVHLRHVHGRMKRRFHTCPPGRS